MGTVQENLQPLLMSPVDVASMSVLRATSGTYQKMVWHSVICPKRFVDRPLPILFRFLAACLCLELLGGCQITMSGFLMNPWQDVSQESPQGSGDAELLFLCASVAREHRQFSLGTTSVLCPAFSG